MFLWQICCVVLLLMFQYANFCRDGLAVLCIDLCIRDASSIPMEEGFSVIIRHY